MDQPSNAAADEPLSDAAPKSRDQVYLPCPAGQAARTPPLPGVSSTGWRARGRRKCLLVIIAMFLLHL
jgi:hypothetical protein